MPTFAQKQRSEWDRFRLTEYDREVIEGLREAQELLKGRESLGDPIDALVSVASGSTIISNPYQIDGVSVMMESAESKRTAL